MSPLRAMVDQLRREALSPRHQEVFAGGRTRQPALTDHQGIASVLEVLADDHEDTYPRREALTQALLAEQQLATAADELGADIAELGLGAEAPPDEDEEPLPALLEQLPEGALSVRSREVLVATMLKQERLRDYVHRTVAGDEQTRERAYQRLKRQRTRALKKLRTKLSVSPRAEVGGFCG